MIVLGMGFGDEGKGLTTSYLCSRTENPITVRFNGGHQAGHTVVYNDKRHIFSGLGSGTLQGAPTYCSKFCTFYPASFMREYRLLLATGITPKVYIHPLCPVTTPFDIDHNRAKEKQVRHGSVGMGFGTTLQRQEDYYKLHVQDLAYESITRQKLHNIGRYYNGADIDRQIDFFMESVRECMRVIQLDKGEILQKHTPIFEGAQGILLDMDFGFFPNVTRSNTTSKNVFQLYSPKEVFYVTRSYLTRHGAGHLPAEREVVIKNNADETNKSHPYQGEFRTAPLNIDLMNYALECDGHFSDHIKKNLVVTCLDQHNINIDSLLKKLNRSFDGVYISRGPSLDDMQKIY